jgi:hypothetical protein
MKKKCKKPPVCPNSCEFIYYKPGVNGKYCGSSLVLQSTGQGCVQCSPQNPCTNGEFPFCLNTWQVIATGQAFFFFTGCGFYESGVCGRVLACVT